MDAKPCGHCLIINNVDFDPQSQLSSRKGSNIDCLKLESRFKALNFIVEVKTNLRQKVRSKSFIVCLQTICTPFELMVLKQTFQHFSKLNMSCQLCLRLTIPNMIAVWSSCCPMGLR